MSAAIWATRVGTRTGRGRTYRARAASRGLSTHSPRQAVSFVDPRVAIIFLLPSQVLLGVEADFSFPAYPDLSGQSTGATANFISPSLGPATYMEAMQASGTVRARVGYVFNDWLLYATGGFAWARNKQTLTQISSGTTDAPFLWRWGWAVGPASRSATSTGRPNSNTLFRFRREKRRFPNSNEVFRSDLALQTVRLGVNYHFGEEPHAPSGASKDAVGRMDADGRGPRQFPRSGHLRRSGLSWDPLALQGPNSLPRKGDGRDLQRHALRRPPPGRARDVGQPGNRPGFWRRQHSRGRRLRAGNPTSRATPFPIRAYSATSCAKP